MTLFVWKRLLWAANGVLAAGIVLSIAALGFMPVDVGQSTQPADETHRAGHPPARLRAEPLSAYEVIYQRDLRRPLFETPGGPAKFEAPRAKPTVRLVGTVLEPGFTYGMFRTKSGELKVVSVGQSVEGAEVTAITQESATVNLNGETIELKVEKEGKP